MKLLALHHPDPNTKSSATSVESASPVSDSVPRLPKSSTVLLALLAGQRGQRVRGTAAAFGTLKAGLAVILFENALSFDQSNLSWVVPICSQCNAAIPY
jgi:hypothetical protein